MDHRLGTPQPQVLEGVRLGPQTGCTRSVRHRMARPAGLEPATPGLEGRCSIQLSYERVHRQCIKAGTWLSSRSQCHPGT